MNLKSLGLGVAGVAFALMPAVQAFAADDLVQVQSPHSVSDTMDRLVQAVEAAGAKVFARVDHAKGGASVGMDIPDNELLIFGNPRLGTPVIRDAQSAGLDLPIRVVVVETADGTALIYRSPAAMAAQHGLPADHPSIVLINGALDKLTAKAAGQ
ncbi:DUF302 domain-containing protein [Hoeflea sp. TYP-13]|uniref:DUF302 domain-containing protein n=1 Tax=Hoeflea sp. TYP-13 TaxID=3230023 RepID=UPI0034C65213